MFSLKHVDDNKIEHLVEAVSVSFNPKGNELIGYGSPGQDIEGVRKDGIVRLTSGHVYVVNDRGDTVGVYNLRTK